MGDVIVVFKIMPNDMANFDQIKKDVELLGPKRLEEEPVAFGLKAIKPTFLVPDEEGKLPELEEKISKIPNVQNSETVMVSRSL